MVRLPIKKSLTLGHDVSPYGFSHVTRTRRKQFWCGKESRGSGDDEHVKPVEQNYVCGRYLFCELFVGYLIT